MADERYSTTHSNIDRLARRLMTVAAALSLFVDHIGGACQRKC